MQHQEVHREDERALENDSDLVGELLIGEGWKHEHAVDQQKLGANEGDELACISEDDFVLSGLDIKVTRFDFRLSILF